MYLSNMKLRYEGHNCTRLNIEKSSQGEEGLSIFYNSTKKASPVRKIT